MAIKYQSVWRRYNTIKSRMTDFLAPDVIRTPIRKKTRQTKDNDDADSRLHRRMIKHFKKKFTQQSKRRSHKSPQARSKKVPLTVDEIQLVASIAKESFYEFVQEFWSVVVPETPVWNWHIKFLCDQLQAMAERVFKGETRMYDLVVNIAPGTTKSMIMSVMFPAWAWTRMPSFKFIGASYSMPLAQNLSVMSRDIVRSDKYMACFPEVRIREDQDTKGYFKNTKGGMRFAVGVNGSVTGMHAHFIVIDDPINPQEALSTIDMKSANHWIKHTLSNRKVNKAVTPTVLVMQRLHQDDPTAVFLKNKKVRHICLPAEIEEGIKSNVYPEELEEFYIQGLMDPVRMNLDVLKEEKSKGEYYYSSQFRQDPVPAGGGMFKVSRVKADVPPTQWRTLVRFWDKAGTKGGGAFTVGVLMGVDMDGRFWILDVIRVQLDSYEREKLIERTAMKDGKHTIVGIEQEPGSGGKESAEATVRNLQGFRVRPIRVDGTSGGKIDRADPWSTQMNGGNVYISGHMKSSDAWEDWAFEFLEEHRYFPHSRYKDQVDAASGAFSLCHKKRIRVGGINASSGYVSNTTGYSGRSLKEGQYSEKLNRVKILAV